MASTTADAVAVRADAKAPVIIDLGKHRRKRIKKLRKGEGALADEIKGCVEELKAAGTLAGDAQTVVVIVQQKRRRLTGLLPGL